MTRDPSVADAPGMSVRDQLDVLLSRAADGEATATDWQAISSLAQQTPGVWDELALAQRQHRALALAVGSAIGAANVAELPINAPQHAEIHEPGARVNTARRPVLSRAAWTGWAAAACVGLAWLGQHRLDVLRPTSTSAGGQTGEQFAAGFPTTIPSSWTHEDLANAYVARGRQQGTVFGELPQRILVASEPAATGDGFDVVYVRQFVERSRVPTMYRFGQDEDGTPVPMRVMPTRFNVPAH
jgi:hypothetical protein